jgi:hypothetical protein
MFGGRATILDLCYTVFMRAKGKNDDDGGPTDWFNDTFPLVRKWIDQALATPTASGERDGDKHVADDQGAAP